MDASCWCHTQGEPQAKIEVFQEGWRSQLRAVVAPQSDATRIECEVTWQSIDDVREVAVSGGSRPRKVQSPRVSTSRVRAAVDLPPTHALLISVASAKDERKLRPRVLGD